jgi:hypothetical protein
MERDKLYLQYPQASVVEERLASCAVEMGDVTPKPFRVDMVRVYGGTPLYSVVIRSAAKEPLRQRLEQLIERPLTFGISSFMLKAEEAQRIVGQLRQ